MQNYLFLFPGFLFAFIMIQNLSQTTAVIFLLVLFLLVHHMTYNLELLVSITIGTDCKTLFSPAYDNESDSYPGHSTEKMP